VTHKPKVMITRQLPEPILSYLNGHCDCTVWEGTGSIPREELLKIIHQYEGLLVTTQSVDAELLERAPLLKTVSSVSVGYNHFDIGEMKARGVIGTHTPYVLDDTVADLVLGLMLSSARRIAELDSFVKQGKWKRVAVKAEDLFGMDVHHATLGIIGMGRIGEAIAKRAVHGFDMNLLYYNRSRKPEVEERFGAAYCSLEELLRRSDFVVLMTPLTPETTKFIRKEHFELMKPSALFINASRGQTVDEQAMIEALRSGTIGGAALDVYEVEPVSPDNPLLQMPNVVTVPHIGSATARTRYDMTMLAAQNLVGAFTGGKANIVPELRDLAARG